MGYSPDHKRIKEKYNPIPTKQERKYHLWLIRHCPCACGGEEPSTVVHHPLTRHPKQRWRRDHEFVVAMNWECHQRLHAAGDERKWRSDLDLPELAYQARAKAIERGIL